MARFQWVLSIVSSLSGTVAGPKPRAEENCSTQGSQKAERKGNAGEENLPFRPHLCGQPPLIRPCLPKAPLAAHFSVDDITDQYGTLF